MEAIRKTLALEKDKQHNLYILLDTHSPRIISCIQNE
jgi:hypothetical protein